MRIDWLLALPFLNQLSSGRQYERLLNTQRYKKFDSIDGIPNRVASVC